MTTETRGAKGVMVGGWNNKTEGGKRYVLDYGDFTCSDLDNFALCKAAVAFANTRKGRYMCAEGLEDGGSALSDEFSIDVINGDTEVSLLSESALHEEFLGYIMDAEEEEE